jgi:elongation factor 1 alpha-like protein
MGLLGGAPEAGGKVSKLAALAAARKQKEGNKTSSPPEGSQAENPEKSSTEQKISLRDRLAASKAAKPAEGLGGLRRLAKPVPAPPPAQKPVSPEPVETAPNVEKPGLTEQVEEASSVKLEPTLPAAEIRASPSMFASAIVGNQSGPTRAEPSHIPSQNVDLLQIYGQDHTEPFDFAGPSPDDVVLNAQNTAKGLAIRRKV